MRILTILMVASVGAACSDSTEQSCPLLPDRGGVLAADGSSPLKDRGSAPLDVGAAPADQGVKKPSLLPTWTDNPCANEAKHTPGYSSTIANWVAQDGQSKPAEKGLVVVGSSSVRYWKRLLLDFSAWKVTQRGYGGSLIWDSVGHAGKIIIPYKPRAVLVYAGTNDIAKGTSPDEVITGYRCLVQKLRLGLGDVHVAFIGITPNPARWKQWPNSAQVNSAIKALATTAPGLHYIDIPSAFLKTGQPPSTSLFVSDKLHLNEAGYKLWTSVIKPVIQKIAPPVAYKMPAGQPVKGSRVLVDFGPDDGGNGNAAKSPDSQGQHWNGWTKKIGGAVTLPGEALGLKTSAGKATPWRLVQGGIFTSNGLKNGGLKAPMVTHLGKLAVATATQDYFYVDKSNGDQGMAITGLDPKRLYKLRLFASREWAAETRITRYTVTGAGASSYKILKTSGNNIGANGTYDGNDTTVVALNDLRPDAYGKLHLHLRAESGTYGYLSLMELTAW